MNHYIFPTTAIVLMVTAPVTTLANDYSRDRDEETKRAIERVDKYEQDQQEAAAKRYNERNQSNDQEIGPVAIIAMFLGFVMVVSLVLAWFYK